MTKRSQSWKDLERTVADKLGGKRVLRGSDFSEKAIDVEVPDFPHWKVDAKYKSKQGWKHHTYLKDVRDKYCREKTDVPILVTKNGREHGACVTMRLEDFAGLVTALRAVRDIIPPAGPARTLSYQGRPIEVAQDLLDALDADAVAGGV